MPVQERCKLVRKAQIGPDTFQLTLEAGRMVRETFRAPGQFVHVLCGDKFLRRPVSVCGCQADLLSLVFEVRGDGTRWLAQRQEGETLDVLGLLGNGFPVDPEGRYLLAGGGIGVPPLYGCAQYCGGRAVAVLGFRTGSRAIMGDAFASACEAVHLYTDDGSLGEKGYVHDGVRAVLEQDRGFTAVLACGPKPMLRGVVETARAFHIPCMVSMEERMACGVGACLGCAVPMADGSMKHVCKDGPVFNGEEVAWDG